MITVIEKVHVHLTK